MKIARRDWMKLAAGSAVGALFTPLPWKLLDDTAIWSQNWSWIPKLPEGEASTAFSACTLCPAGCGLRARQIGGMPVSIEGVAGHPFSRGALCPVGIAAHQAAFHPRRVRWPLQRVPGKSQFVQITREAAAEKVSAAVARGGIGILDMRPGRTASALYRRFAAQSGGAYLVSPAREEATLNALAGMLGREPGALGLDLSKVRTMLSFGAPVLDGWSAPGLVFELWSGAKPFRLIQAEPRTSRTAMAADDWLPIRPGTESALAAGIARALSNEDVSEASAATGIPAEVILKIARELAKEGPSVVIGGGDPGGGPFTPAEDDAIAALNLMLPDGAIVERATIPLPQGLEASQLAPVTRLADAADHSMRVLLIDASAGADPLPWSIVERKLAGRDAIVIAFSDRGDGLAQHADLIVPTPAHLEAAREYLTPPFADRASFGIAPALIPEAGGIDPVELVLKENTGEWLARRATAVYELKRGSVFNPEDGKSTLVKDIPAADEFVKQLNAGCCWVDDPIQKPAVLATGRGRPNAPAVVHRAPPGKLTLLPFGWRVASSGPATTPLLTKLYQESELRESPARVAMNPESAAAEGLVHGDPVVVQTRCGSCRRTLVVDAAVMPGVIEAAVGADDDVIGLCADGSDTWRLSEAAIRRAS